MNKLKWYDFFGALLLLVSVTKSAIEPPQVVEDSSPPLDVVSPTTMGSREIAPREAALSQVDMLTPASSGYFVETLTATDNQAEQMSGRSVGLGSKGGSPTKKSLSKVFIREETRPDPNGSPLGGSQPPIASQGPVFSR